MTQLEIPATAKGDRVVFDDLEIGEIAVDLDDQEPADVIEWALDALGDRIAIVTALQADGMVILDMAYRMRPDIRVVTVDTGRLPQETYAFIDEARERYPQARWDVLFPDAAEVHAMVRQHGTDLFRRSVNQRLLCCQVRKVRPLTRALRGLDGWFTGLRRDQWTASASAASTPAELAPQICLRRLERFAGKPAGWDRPAAEHERQVPGCAAQCRA